MAAARILKFTENLSTMTYAQARRFIERTRRQLDRFEQAFPNPEVGRLTPQEERDLRSLMKKLESDMDAPLGA